MTNQRLRILLAGHAFVHPRHAAVGLTLARFGFNVRVVAPDRWAGIVGALDPEEREAPRYERCFLPVRGGMSFDDTWLEGLVPSIVAFRPDVVAIHAELHARLTFEALRAARRANAATAVWVHDPLPGEAPAPFSVYEALAREGASAVVCAGSSALARKVAARGVPADRIHRIPSTGVRVDLFAPAEEPREGPPRVLVVGHHVRERGTPEVVAAIETVLSEDRPVEVLFAGRGPERAVVEGLADRHGDRVRVVEPPASYAAVADLLRTGDIAIRHAVAMPGRAEPRPQPALEAAASGCALVATPVGGLDEVFHDGRSALLVSPGDARGLCSALRALVSNAEGRRAIAAAGRGAVIETHFLETVAAKQAALLLKLAGARTASGIRKVP